MINRFTLLACLLLAGCAATQEVRDAATTAWGDCVMRQVARLDDGKSDPFSVAIGIAPACAVLYQQLTDVMMQGMTTENSQAFMREKMRQGEMQSITSAILIYRSKHRK